MHAQSSFLGKRQDCDVGRDSLKRGNRKAPHLVCRRSLYPNIRVVRQHYVFTSHAGAPLAVWDRRSESVLAFPFGDTS